MRPLTRKKAFMSHVSGLSDGKAQTLCENINIRQLTNSPTIKNNILVSRGHATLPGLSAILTAAEAHSEG